MGFVVLMLYVSGLTLGACLTAIILTVPDISSTGLVGLALAGLAAVLNSIAFYLVLRRLLQQPPTIAQTEGGNARAPAA